MLLAQYAVFLVPAHLLGFLCDLGVNGLHLALPFNPLGLTWVRGLVAQIDIVLDVL